MLGCAGGEGVSFGKDMVLEFGEFPFEFDLFVLGDGPKLIDIG